MNNTKTLATTVIGLIVMAITCLIYFTAVGDRGAISGVSLLFIIISEIVATVGFIMMDIHDKHSAGMMFRSGAYSLLSIYFLIATAISAFFLIINSNSIKWLVTIQMIVCAVVAITMILLLLAGKSVSKKDNEILKSSDKLKELENKVLFLKNNSNNDKYVKMLEKVYEAIKYCDNTAVVPSDNLIAEKIEELETELGKNADDNDDTDDKVKTLTDAIMALSVKRTAEVKDLKQGGI